ncbi:hypothetical protein [uncultured Flavobacterium sp.]|uniref:hypothetical protein n=1 Tax=uncultured Flavobacterium sp. TaxID=165435 RepID=UPI0025D02BB9|nr:hypothetical protein [uncultured Flavobacterium sp.]
MSSYKGIEFAKGYNKPFAEFKKEFEGTHIFKNMHPDIREKELKIAHKTAVNGNSSRTVKKSKEGKPEEPEE